MERSDHRGRPAAVALAAVAAVAAMASPRAASAETAIGHEVTAGLTGVYDGGYDRGLRYGVAYELRVSMLRFGLFLAAGDTDPRREQHWGARIGVVPIECIRLTVGFHHRTFTTYRFGDNLLSFVGGVRFRGLLFDAGLVLRFPITRQDLIHSPVEFDLELFEYLFAYRLGYLWSVGRGVSVGLESATISLFEVRNFNYPSFAIVVEWSHPAVGRLRGEVGLATAGFWSSGATIDRFFVRLEFSREMP